MEDILFDAPDIVNKNIVIDKSYVESKLKDKVKKMNMSKYIL